MRRVWILLFIVAGVALATTIQLKIGSGVPPSLIPGEFATDTNSMSVYVGNPASNAVLVASASWSNNVTAAVTNGLATTNFAATAAGARVATNDATYLSLASTNHVWTRVYLLSNAWLQVDTTGTNLWFIAGAVTNQVNATVIP